MGLAYNVYLNSNKIFGCRNCKTHLADFDEIISRVRINTLSITTRLLANLIVPPG
jgi:hypothetical protein